MLGIYTDTGGFKFPATTSATFYAAANLAEIAPDYASVISFMENNVTPGVIAYEALALSSVTLHCGGKVAISAVSYNDLQDKKIDKGEIFPDIASMLKSVVGWEVGIKIVEDEPGAVRVSMRTRDQNKYDVSKITAALGGGGHKAAAGARVKMSLDEAVKKVLEAIVSVYPELGKQ
jgi:phosphoesterase RecJ-like protein